MSVVQHPIDANRETTMGGRPVVSVVLGEQTNGVQQSDEARAKIGVEG
jgi:hypothetical protein